MMSIESRLSAQLDMNLKGYLDAKVLIIQDELRGMVTTVGEVTSTELRAIQTELGDVRNAATAGSSGQCPCVSGNCPCKCNTAVPMKEPPQDARGFDPWFGKASSSPMRVPPSATVFPMATPPGPGGNFPGGDASGP